MRLGKATTSGLLCSGMLLAAMNAQANQQIAQVPLSLSEGVPPNMLFTLDDSTSMAWGYVPDATAQAYKDKIQGTNTRRFRASNTNAMYYNPGVIYEVPPAFESNGTEFTFPSSFTEARHNGFSNNNGTVNLSNSYRVVYEHQIPNTNISRANHPDDFYCRITGFNSDGTRTCGKNEQQQIKIEITRTSTSSWFGTQPSCTAKAYAGEDEKTVLSPSCSISNGTATVDMRATGVPAYYYEFDPSMDDGKCAGKQDDVDAGGEKCYRLRWVDENSAYDENGVSLRHANGESVNGKTNFAIWYSFYKTRNLATLSAAGIAFYNLSPDVRFTWQSLIHCTQLDRDSHGTTEGARCGVNGFKPYSRTHKVNFYDWLYGKSRFNRAGGTPLRSALQRSGEFLSKSKAWVKDPVKNEGESYACRPSYNIIMTDGIWNGDTNISAPENHDGKERALPDGTSYSKQRPYADGTSKTLSDYAFHYWSTDLMPGLENNVPAHMPYRSTPANTEKDYWDPRNNPATWQHMSNFIMGLGLSTSLARADIPWEGKTHGGTGYANLLAGTDWPAPSGSANNGNGSPDNVYDLWHAALNSRGEFYSVDTPEAMVQAFNDILTRIADRKASAAMPGMSMSLESDGAGEDAADRLVSYSYQTSFDSADGWTGEIQKTKSYRQWNSVTRQFENVVEAEWKASEKLPPNRNIKMANDAGNALEDFTTDKASQALQDFLAINPDPGKQSGAYTWQDRLNYIRGTRTHEGVEEGKMRQRSSLLGDFLSSQPVVVSGARYLEGFANRLEGNTAYTSFMASIANRSPMLYVGGNAGMLHAFDTATGVEKFAFVPTAVFSKLNKLTGHNYTHEYYVDGTPVIADAYDGTSWRTILVGTLRAGGKGLFALDVTDVGKVGGGPKLLWELHENSSEAEDLDVKPGYSFSKPTVARLHNGKWAVVTGNGYEGDGSNNGAAALYIIDAFSGEMIEELTVQSEAIGSNGLSTPRLVDFDSDGVADYAYAGDLHGNLWRFDLLGAGANPERTDGPIYGDKTGGTDNFKVSYGGKPMFIAESSIDVNGSKVRQPITSAPSVVRHPTRTGYLVVFGTGRYLYQGDKAGETSHAQTLYGIWDMKTKAESTAEDIIPPGKLVSQSITSQTTGTGETTGVTRTARVISNNSVEWYKDFDSSKDVEKRGWRLDLQVGNKREGEMMIEDMRVLGNTLFIQTLVPNADPCGNGADNWLYAINPATGGKTLHHAFDTRGTNDVIISAIKFGSEGGVSIGQDETGFKANAPGDVEPITPDPSSMGRQSWRMIDDA